MKACQNCRADLRDTATVCIKCGYIQSPEVPCAKPSGSAGAVDPVEAEFPVITVPEDFLEKSTAPAALLKTKRGLLKYLLLSVLTLGIYGIAVMEDVSMDINILAGRYDGKRTMSYCLVMFLFSWLTLGIVPLVWSHRVCARIGAELTRRGISYRFDAGTFWGWGFFGSLILVGPFIYTHKLLKSMNLLAAHYNTHG